MTGPDRSVDDVSLAPIWVDSAGPDGVPVRVALHHVAPAPSAAPLLISHATGFHGWCYRALAESLAGHYDAYSMDHRGHGSTPVPSGWTVDWSGFAADTIAVASRLAGEARSAVVGFGHSMGGGTLLLAARDRPDLFERLVLFEPIAVPPGAFSGDPEQVPLAAGARRRRAWFESLDAAHANFAAKPPMSLMRDDVLWDYVRHGFRPAAEGRGVELACSPDHESDTFMTALTAGVWEALPEVTVPTVVIASGDGGGPAEGAAPIAERLVHGTLVKLPEQTHFGPLSHPREVAQLVRERRTV